MLAERWRVHYNTVRPHSSLGYRSPAPAAWLTEVSAWKKWKAKNASHFSTPPTAMASYLTHFPRYTNNPLVQNVGQTTSRVTMNEPFRNEVFDCKFKVFAAPGNDDGWDQNVHSNSKLLASARIKQGLPNGITSEQKHTQGSRERSNFHEDSVINHEPCKLLLPNQ